jgi:hypothetical protein
MSGNFGITYKQALLKVFLPAGPSATKHGPNRTHFFSWDTWNTLWIADIFGGNFNLYAMGPHASMIS